MFDLYLFPFLIHFSDSFISGKFTKYFLTPKEASKHVLAIWWLCFFLTHILFETFERYFNINFLILAIAINMAVFYCLQIYLFKKDFSKQIFVIASFLSGKYLIEYICRVCNSNFVNWVIYIQQNISSNFINSDFLKSIQHKIQVTVIVLIYSALLYAYTYLIEKVYVKKDYKLNKREGIFLVFPCLTALCVCVTMNLIFSFIEKEANMFIYDKIPSTNFWVPLICIMLASIIVANVALFQNLVKYNEESQKRIILENQVIQTRKEVTEIENIYSDMRGLRHDMQRHINSILLYVRNDEGKNTAEIESYIGKMQETIGKLDFSYHCGNPIIDIIIHQAQQLAKREGICFDVNFVYPRISRHCEERNDVAIQNDSKSPIDVYHIAVILNNAIENAFEACQKVAGEKSIYLHSYLKGNLYFIEIENDFSDQITFNETTGLPESHKPDKKNHGIGLANIQKCAKKYLGDIDIEITSNNGRQRFNLTVMMKLAT